MLIAGLVSPRFFSPEQNSVVAGEASLEFHNRGKAEGETGLKQQVGKRSHRAIGNCIAEHQSQGQSLPPIGWVSLVTLNVIILKCSLLCKSHCAISKPRRLPRDKWRCSSNRECWPKAHVQIPEGNVKCLLHLRQVL